MFFLVYQKLASLIKNQKNKMTFVKNKNLGLKIYEVAHFITLKEAYLSHFEQ